MPRLDSSSVIFSLLAEARPFSSSEVAERAGVSRQAAHKTLRKLEEAGTVRSEGAGRAARWLGKADGPLRLRFPLATSAEDRIWTGHLASHPGVVALGPRARSLLSYAATEMLNNAIEHSGGRELELRFEVAGSKLILEVLDDGVGIFEHVRKKLKLPLALDAAAELTKGKVTTDPARHSGEGIFFTSKASTRFEAQSGGLRWLVDNDRSDTAILEAPPGKGTRIRVELPRKPARSLKQVFARYTDGSAFTRTEIVVKLFEHGTDFVSRSEARRLLHGLDRFRRVTLDFRGVSGVGQGFADEVFRVWPARHPGIELKPIRMAAPVKFMVRRATRR